MIAESLLKNQGLCDAKKFQLILAKIWKATVSGDSSKRPEKQRAKMWHEFHTLCCDDEFVSKFTCYLCTASLEQPCSILFIQTLLRKLFEKLLHLKSKSDITEVSHEVKIPPVEENILRYAAGFVPFSLKRQCMKRQSSDPHYNEKIVCLNSISVSNEVGNAQTFLDYTESWLEKQNRGGCFSSAMMVIYFLEWLNITAENTSVHHALEIYLIQQILKCPYLMLWLRTTLR